MKKSFCFAIAFAAIFISCKSAPKAETTAASAPAPVVDGVPTYVNTSVNNATGTISTILVFNSITEVTAIHPSTGERFSIDQNNFVYNPNTTELRLRLGRNVSYKITDLTYRIVGAAKDPAVFVLSGIDTRRAPPGVFFKGKLAVEGVDYFYEPKAFRLTSLVPLNAENDSYHISWATNNGTVTFSNKTENFKSEYRQLFDAWSRKIIY